jgi:hypothetical protein
MGARGNRWNVGQAALLEIEEATMKRLGMKLGMTAMIALFAGGVWSW